jgi:phage terminase small subunit
MPAKPTAKQAKALELIREGMPPTKAMREAGYSEETAQAPGRELLRSAGAQTIIEQYRAEFTQVGITPRYMAEKAKELMEAETVKSSMTGPDIRIPDNKTRLEAWKEARQDLGFVEKTESPNPFGAKGGSITVTWGSGESF